MNKKKVMLISLVVVNLILITSIFSCLHNIDLVYNAQKGLIDCNKFVCEDLESIYQNSYMYLWLLIPLDIFFSLVLGYYLKE